MPPILSAAIFLIFFLWMCAESFYVAKIVKSSSNMKLNGFFDNLAQSLAAAFENDSEYAQKDDPGTSKRLQKANPGRKVQPYTLHNTMWNISLALSGIPINDPSMDLYAPKARPGKIDGLRVNLNVTMLEDGKLFIADNDFTMKSSLGKWKLDEDGTSLAFSFLAEGFERTIVTKGSLQSIYGGDDSLRTSSTYFVPAGPCLVQCVIVMNGSGRLIISDGKVFAKDPRDVNAGKWSQTPAWKRAGTMLTAIEVLQ